MRCTKQSIPVGTFCLISLCALACSTGSVQPKQTHQTSAVRSDDNQSKTVRNHGLVAYISTDGVTTSDSKGHPIHQMPMDGDQSATLAQGVSDGRTFLLAGPTIYALHWPTLTQRRIARLSQVETADYDVRAPHHFRAASTSSTLCLLLSKGDPGLPDSDGQPNFQSINLVIDVKTGTVQRGTCPDAQSSSSHQSRAHLGKTMALETENKACQLRIGQTRYPLARLSSRNGGGCEVKVGLASPSNRFQIIYASRGGNDAAELEYLVYMVDKASARLVPLGKHRREPLSQETPSAPFAMEVIVDSYLGLEGLPWRWARHQDALLINDLLMDLRASPMVVTPVAAGTVFLD